MAACALLCPARAALADDGGGDWQDKVTVQATIATSINIKQIDNCQSQVQIVEIVGEAANVALRGQEAAAADISNTRIGGKGYTVQVETVDSCAGTTDTQFSLGRAALNVNVVPFQIPAYSVVTCQVPSPSGALSDQACPVNDWASSSDRAARFNDWFSVPGHVANVKGEIKDLGGVPPLINSSVTLKAAIAIFKNAGDETRVKLAERLGFYLREAIKMRSASFNGSFKVDGVEQALANPTESFAFTLSVNLTAIDLAKAGALLPDDAAALVQAWGDQLSAQMIAAIPPGVAPYFNAIGFNLNLPSIGSLP